MTHPLPPLPERECSLDSGSFDMFTADQMRDYARAALAAVPAPIYSKSVVKRLATQMGLVSDDAPAAPAPTVVPLSDEQIRILWRTWVGTNRPNLSFARAIEAAHGITAAKGEAL